MNVQFMYGYGPRTEEPQERPSWDASSLIGQFAAGWVEGMTTFDILGDYDVVGRADTNAEQISRSLGSVLGFIGILPIPGSGLFTKTASVAASRAFKLIGNTAKASEWATKAARTRMLTASVPLIGGKALATGTMRMFEMDAAKSALKFMEKASGREFSAATKGIAESVTESALFMGYASAIGARPVNPMDVFTPNFWEDRGDAFLRGIPMGAGQSFIANTITPKLMNKMGFANFDKLMETDPGKANHMLKLLRGVSVGMAMGGYAALEGYPTELALYETLVNGVFGYRDVPWYDKTASRLASKHLTQENIAKYIAAGHNPARFLESVGEQVQPQEVLDSFALSANAALGTSARTTSAFLNALRYDYAQKRGLDPELVTDEEFRTMLLENGNEQMTAMYESLERFDEIITVEKNKIVDEYTRENGFPPNENEMGEINERAADSASDIYEQLTLSGVDAAKQVREVARRARVEKDMAHRVPDEMLKIAETMREDGVSQQAFDVVKELQSVLTSAGRTGFQSVTTLVETMREHKKAGNKQFEPFLKDVQGRLGVTLTDEALTPLRRLFATYSNGRTRTMFTFNGAYDVYHAPEYTKDGRPIYTYDNQTPIEMMLGRPMVAVKSGFIDDDGKAKLVPVNDPRVNSSRIITSMFKNGYWFFSGKKDNSDHRYVKKPLNVESDGLRYSIDGETVDLSQEMASIDAARMDSEPGKKVVLGDSMKAYEADRESFAAEATAHLDEKNPERNKELDYARKAYDALSSYNILQWKKFNNLEWIGDGFADKDAFSVTDVFKFNKRTQLLMDVGIPLDPTVIGKEKFTARIIGWSDDTKGAFKAFDKTKPNGEKRSPLQDDGVLWVRRTMASKMGLLSDNEKGGFHKVSTVYSDEMGGFIGKQGVHVMTEGEEKAMDDAGIMEDVLFFDSATKLKGKRPMTTLRLLENGTVVRGGVDGPFEIPVESFRLNLSAVEDQTAGDIHWVKQLMNHFEENPALARKIFDTVVKPSFHGDEIPATDQPMTAEMLEAKMRTNTARFRSLASDPTRDDENIDLDKVPVQDLFAVLEGLKDDGRLRLLTNKLLAYHLDVSDDDGTDYGNMARLRQMRSSIGLKLSGQKITGVLIGQPDVYRYMEQALYNYTLQRVHRPKYANSFKSRLGYLSPIEIQRLEKQLGREIGENDLVLEGGLKKKPIELPAHLRGFFGGKDSVTLGEMWDRLEKTRENKSIIRSLLIAEGKHPDRIVNDIDLARPEFKEAVMLDPTLTDAQKKSMLESGWYEGVPKKAGSLGSDKQFVELEDFFNRTVGVRVPLSDLSGARVLKIAGFTEGTGYRTFVHPYAMKYMDGADLDGDSAFFYFGMDKELTDYLELPQVKHRFTTWQAPIYGKDVDGNDVIVGVDVKTLDDALANPSLIEKNELGGRKYMRDFSPSKEGDAALMSSEDYSWMKNPALMFSPRARVMANNLASIGKDNLGPGLVAALRGKQFWKYLQYNSGKVTVDLDENLGGKMTFVAKASLNDQKLRQFRTVNLSADAADGAAMADVDRIRVANIISVADVYKNGRKLSEKEAIDILSKRPKGYVKNRNKLPVNQLPLVRQIYDLDIAIRPRTFEGDVRPVGEILDAIQSKAGILETEMKTLNNVWYDTSMLLGSIKYSPEVMPMLNAVSYKVNSEILDAFFKRSGKDRVEKRGIIPTVDDAVGNFIQKMVGTRLSFTRSQIVKTSKWTAIKERLGDKKANEYLNEFINSPDFRNSRLWNYLRSFPLSGKAKKDITPEVMAELAQSALHVNDYIVKYDASKWMISNGDIVRVFDEGDQESSMRKAQEYIEKNGIDEGSLDYVGPAPRKYYEQVREARKLTYKDVNEVASIRLLNLHLSKFVSDNAGEDVAGFIEKTLMPLADKASKLRSELIESQQNLYSSNPQRTQLAHGLYAKKIREIEKYRQSLTDSARPAFDALFASMIQPKGVFTAPDQMVELQGRVQALWKKMESRMKRKADAIFQGENLSADDMDKLVKKMTMDNYQYHNYYAETPLNAGIISEGMVRQYYEMLNDFGRLSQVDPENIKRDELLNELDINPYKGTPRFVDADPEAAQMQTHKELTKELRSRTGGLRRLLEAASGGRDSAGRIKDPLMEARYQKMENDLRDIFMKYPDVANMIGWIMPSITAKRTGGKVHRSIEFSTINDWEDFIAFFKDPRGRFHSDSGSDMLKVKNSWFFRKFGSIAKESFFKEAFPGGKVRTIAYEANVQTPEGPKKMMVRRIIGAMEEAAIAADALTATKNTVDGIVKEFAAKSFTLFNQLNEKHNGLGKKVMASAISFIESKFADPEITPKGWELYRDFAADASVTMEKLRQQYRDGVSIVEADGKARMVSMDEVLERMKQSIYDYQDNIKSLLESMPDDALFDEFKTGRSWGKRGLLEEFDMDKVGRFITRYGNETGRFPLISKRLIAKLAANEVLQDMDIVTYGTNDGNITFEAGIGTKARKEFEKMVEGKTAIRISKKFGELPDAVKHKFADAVEHNGYILGYDVDVDHQTLGRNHFPHINLSDKVLEENLRSRVQTIGDNLSMEDLKNISLDLLKMASGSREFVYDPQAGQQMFARLFAKSDAMNTLNYRTSSLRRRDHSEFGPVPDWDHSPLALMVTHEKIMRENADMFFALKAKNLLRRQRAGMEYGEHTQDVSRFVERYFRQTLGYADTIPKDWGEGYKFGIEGRMFYKFHSDQYWIDKIQSLGETWFGGKTMGDFKQIDDLSRKLKFDSEEERVEWVRQGKETLAERKLSWLSQMEAKWSLVSLLTSPKTFVTNVASAGLMTLINTSAEDFRKAISFKEVQMELGPDIIKSSGDIDRVMNELGALEGMIQQELNLHGGSGFLGRGAFADVIHEVRTKGTEADVKGVLNKHGVLSRFVDAGAYMMKKSELIARKHSLLAHYMNARRSLRQQGFELAWDDPWVVKIARDGVAASQFLYSNAHRPAFMGTLAGKIFHRFQLFAYNSIEFRKNVIQAASKAGIAYESDDYKKFERMFLADMFVFGMASMIPMSMFGNMLPPPYNYMNGLIKFFFGRNEEERQNAFYNGLPHPLNIVQPLTPPSARVFVSLLNFAYDGDVDKLGMGLLTMLPGHRFGKDVYKTYDQIANKHRNPAVIIDNMTGIPLVYSGNTIRRLQKDDGFDAYLARYSGDGIYFDEAEKNEADIDRYLGQMSAP